MVGAVGLEPTTSALRAYAIPAATASDKSYKPTLFIGL